MNETKILEDLVGDVKKFARIHKKTCEILLPFKETLNQKERILCYLIGKKYANRLSCKEVPYVTIDELSSELRIKRESVIARISELQKNGYIKKLKKGVYIINIDKLRDIVNEIIMKINIKCGMSS